METVAGGKGAKAWRSICTASKYMLKPGTCGDDNDDDNASVRGFDLDASDNPLAIYTWAQRCY